MAGPLLYDRVRETSTTTGTGTLTLAGALSGYQAFSVVGNANTCYYTVVNRGTAEWEVGIGTYTLSGTTLARTTILASSNAGAAVSFSAGTKDVFLTAPADILGPPTEVSITGATTLTSAALSRSLASLKWHVCSGTSADYTVDLPAVSGNAGKYLAIRMDPALTKLVTLDGNSSELINGATTRVMWANEFATLYCNGSAWSKIAGQTIAHNCMLESASATTANHDVATKFNLGTSLFDIGSIGVTASSRITARRAGNYTFSMMANFTSLAADTRVVGYVYTGATPSAYKLFGSSLCSIANSLYLSGSAGGVLAAGHHVELFAAWDVSGGSGTKASNWSGSVLQVNPYLSVTEVPQW